MLSAFVQKPENDPFRRAQDERVTVEFLSARARGRATPGRSIGASRPGTRTAAPSARPSPGARCCARSLLTPKTAEAMKKNPIGLYIDELHWDKVGG